MKSHKKRYPFYFGPGIITGAADDDPSGIATYSQTGAQFGYLQLWTALFMLPLQIAIQEACARIGAVTGNGLAAVIRDHFGKKILYFVVFLLLCANIINIGADIGAMAESVRLIMPINLVLLMCFFTVLMILLEIFVSYKKYAKILLWLCLSLLAYPLTLFIIHKPWITLLKATFIPHIESGFQFWFILTGILGTTISPYLFFWEASEETEEERVRHMIRKTRPPHPGKFFMQKMRFDNFVGMFFSEIITWCIIAVAATVLHANGVTDIRTAADAAKALEPLVHTFPYAGYLAKLLFVMGILGLGLLAIPVLAGSAAYAICDVFNWKQGLNLKFKKAHGFYGIIIIATGIGLFLNFTKIDPFKALVYAAVINGVVAVPLIFVIGLIARNRDVMGNYKSSLLSEIFVWLTFISIAVAVIFMFVNLVSIK